MRSFLPMTEKNNNTIFGLQKVMPEWQFTILALEGNLRAILAILYFFSPCVVMYYCFNFFYVSSHLQSFEEKKIASGIRNSVSVKQKNPLADSDFFFTVWNYGSYQRHFISVHSPHLHTSNLNYEFKIYKQNQQTKFVPIH